MDSSDKDRSTGRFSKIPAKYAGILLPLLLTFFMTCIVSLISTLRGIGLAPIFGEYG